MKIKKQEDVAAMVAMYNSGFSMEKIGEKMRVSSYIVKKSLQNKVAFRAQGSWARKYTCNSDFFDKINTQEKAYWLGFLYADCYVREGGIQLLLKQSDQDHVKKFKHAIKATNPVELRSDKVKYKNGQTGIQHTAKLRISDVKMSKDLQKLGCFINKTHKLSFPTENQVPDRLVKHFMRGYFDGDGSVWQCESSRSKKFGASLTSTNEFILKFKKKLNKLTNSEIGQISFHKNSNFSILSFSSVDSFNILRDFFYKDSEVHMERKFSKFKQFPSTTLRHALRDTLNKIMEHFDEGGELSTKDIMKRLSVKLNKAQMLVKKLVGENKIEQVGYKCRYAKIYRKKITNG